MYSPIFSNFQNSPQNTGISRWIQNKLNKNQEVNTKNILVNIKTEKQWKIGCEYNGEKHRKWNWWIQEKLSNSVKQNKFQKFSEVNTKFWRKKTIKFARKGEYKNTMVNKKFEVNTTGFSWIHSL